MGRNWVFEDKSLVSSISEAEIKDQWANLDGPGRGLSSTLFYEDYLSPIFL